MQHHCANAVLQIYGNDFSAAARLRQHADSAISQKRGCSGTLYAICRFILPCCTGGISCSMNTPSKSCDTRQKTSGCWFFRCCVLHTSFHSLRKKLPLGCMVLGLTCSSACWFWRMVQFAGTSADLCITRKSSAGKAVSCWNGKPKFPAPALLL